MTIIIGWVPRPEGDAALDRAIEEATLRSEQLVVLNASSGASYNDVNYATEEQLASVQDRLDAAGIDYDLRQMLRGKEPSDEVIDVAASLDASMVVIGLRHRSSVGKFLMGSSAQEILMGVHCPVLAVPANAAQHSALQLARREPRS